MMDSASDSFALGVCYYPEHWPRDRWEQYARDMRELGLTYVRIAEFAWSRMEPSPGRFEWRWLDEAIETLHAEGLKVVLCTPTAAPPAWLVRQHPEVLPVDAEGHVLDFGSRRHYDFASEVYREQSRRITTAISERYGQHPAVVGWQTDNEFGGMSYGPASRDGFRAWLQHRYGTLKALNEAWGNVFWSQEYSDWSQIDPPNLTVAQPNPSHVLDYQRFFSDLVVSFQEEQVSIVRQHSPGRFVTHNFMGFFGEFDHYKAAACLDFPSWDSYPLGHIQRRDLDPDIRLRYARTGHPDFISFNHDLYRGLKPGPFWVMEQQCGQVNWAPYNPLPAQGAVQLWTAQANAHGADVVSYFRWRAATFAQELMHSGLLRHDETLDRGGEEVRALDLSDLVAGNIHAPVALLHDYESLWVYGEQPHNRDTSYWGQVMMYYQALRSLGVDVDIRHPDSDLSSYRLIVAPALQLIGEERARNLERVAEGARLVFGPRTGYRSPSGAVHSDGQPGPLAGLLGCKLENFDSMPPGLEVTAGGHPVVLWAESYRLVGGSALYEYESGPLAGHPAVVEHGPTTTIGAWSQSLVAEIIVRRLEELGIDHVALPEGVRRATREGSTFYFNFNPEPARLPDGTLLPPVCWQMRSGRTSD